MKKLMTSLTFAVVLGASVSAGAADPELCLDCHEPAEDWQGMSAQEILAEAKNTKIKRHADNRELSDEELAAMIAALLKK
ncbi:MAG: hypothetical protein HKN19_10950 [Halioglobus sp.]|nr:hypothetical protein [Halioglobus sp.]